MEKRLEMLYAEAGVIREGYGFGSALSIGDGLSEGTKKFISGKASIFTRLEEEENGRGVVQREVKALFDDYLNLYIRYLLLPQPSCESDDDHKRHLEQHRRGMEEYKHFRLTSDPARPILTKLFGKEVAEGMIGELYS